MSRPLALVLLLVCTCIWGLAFVAQKWAMGGIGPLAFTGPRFLLATIALAPFALAEYRKRTAAGVRLTRRDLGSAAVVCGALFAGSTLQQYGLIWASVTNGGFLTALYVLFVPLIGLLLGIRPHPILWIGVLLALLGVYLLNGATLDRLNLGDLLLILCAVAFAIHIHGLARFTTATGMPVFVSALSFAFTGVISSVAAPIFEPVTLDMILGNWVAIAYVGLFSTALGFTIQAAAQQILPPANAAIMLSTESLFAAIWGAIILGERLTPIGYVGAALIFCAVLAVEVVPALRAARPRPAS